MYIFPEPPYFLLVAGLLMGITSGTAFDATLRQAVQAWSKNRSTRTLANLQGFQLFFPFLGICLGVCLFLASGVEVFGFPRVFAYGLAIPLTIGTAWLVWSQLGKILIQLEQGGSKALDLDSIN
ncbi:hypothetical protein BST81_07055 [Leptolyngbya sp. 'hensonii']|uniref:hypothetical protein n=1 Tax=Leptolyngbya sp. 'hensonii' TaxID=1922337 RepID=UPI00094FD32A|nr:hypothetical protein [Leptolyngbya sp. 'hensonii']OLP19135.1 hypothetical protein BST81_07055 [Leptolyngbya sp. 'hensonii']